MADVGPLADNVSQVQPGEWRDTRRGLFVNEVVKGIDACQSPSCMTNDLSGPPSAACNYTYTSESSSSTGQRPYQLVAEMRWFVVCQLPIRVEEEEVNKGGWSDDAVNVAEMFFCKCVLLLFPEASQSLSRAKLPYSFQAVNRLERASRLCWLGSSLPPLLSYRWLAFGIVSPEVTLVLRRSSGEPWSGRASLCSQAARSLSGGTGGSLKEESKPQLRSSDLSPAGAGLDTKSELSESRLSFHQQVALNPASVMHRIKRTSGSSRKEGPSTGSDIDSGKTPTFILPAF